MEQVNFDQRGLVPVILQDIRSKEVLMLAYMNRESLEKTIETGKACFWSRSRQEIWLKGETSGNYQYVHAIRVDCDHDTLLILVEPAGPACHTGKQSCFHRALLNSNSDDLFWPLADRFIFLKKLDKLITDRKVNPDAASYTSYLFREGLDKISKKIGEEAAEVIIAAKNEKNEEIIAESADLLYHLLVLLKLYDISLEEILSELESRSK